MTEFVEIYDAFKSKIIDYEFLTLSAEDEEVIMNVRLRSALAKFKASKKNIKANYDMQTFNRILSDEEIEALSYWLLYEWLLPKVNDTAKISRSFYTKQFEGTSPANLLIQLQNLRDKAQSDAVYYTNQLSNSAKYVLGGEDK